MDRSKIKNLRNKYPDHAPVVCVHPTDPIRLHKLIVPHCKTGEEFVTIIQGKCPWADDESNFCIKTRGGVKLSKQEISRASSVKALDVSQNKASDDVLFVEVEDAKEIHSEAKGEVKAEPIAEAKEDPKPRSEPEEEQEIEMSNSIQQFKMNSAAKDSCDSQKAMSDESDPAQKSRAMRKKYPDRVPVLVNQGETPGLPKIERKLLVPRTMKPADLRKSLPKHLKLQDSNIPWDKVCHGSVVATSFWGQLPDGVVRRMLMAGNEEEEDKTMGSIYDSLVDPDDGGLHLTLEMEETFALDKLVSAEDVVQPSLEIVEDEKSIPKEQIVKTLQEAKEEVDEANRKAAEEAQRADMAEMEVIQALETSELRMQELQEEKQLLRDDLDEEVKARVKSQEQVRILEKELQGIKKEISARVEERLQVVQKRFEEDKEELLNSHYTLQAELLNSQNTLQAAQTALMQTGCELQAAEEKNSQLEERLQVLERERDNSQRRFRNDEESILRLKEMCTALKDKLTCSEETHDQMARAQESEKGVMTRMEQENLQLKADLQAMTEEKERLTEEKVRLLEEVTKLKAEEEEDDEEDEVDDIAICGWDKTTGQPAISEEGKNINIVAPN